MTRIRHFARICLISAGLVATQAVVAMILPPIALVFYLLTVALLEEIERAGFPTLQGSPDGFPIPTVLGWCVTALAWWACWMAILGTLGLWRSWRIQRHRLAK